MRGQKPKSFGKPETSVKVKSSHCSVFGSFTYKIAHLWQRTSAADADSQGMYSTPPQGSSSSRRCDLQNRPHSLHPKPVHPRALGNRKPTKSTETGMAPDELSQRRTWEACALAHGRARAGHEAAGECVPPAPCAPRNCAAPSPVPEQQGLLSAAVPWEMRCLLLRSPLPSCLQ